MKPAVPTGLLNRAKLWDTLSRRERADLAKELRRLGLMQSEIRELIPVPKSTLSYWCRDVRLTKKQIEDIRQRGYSQAGVPRDTQRRRRSEVRAIRSRARKRAVSLARDPRFSAGVALYWAEGAKTTSDLALANTDPALLRAFISWVRTYLDTEAEFRLSLHLHDIGAESQAKRFWRRELGLPAARFTKTYFKAPGTGHRKNRLRYGVCRVRVCRSTDLWHTTMAWIEHARDQTLETVATIAPGR